nr:hypothetical protein [Tanacetum cinerariifolium]
MKAVSENTEAEVDQNAVDRKYDEKERKNILITIENLIANCIAQEVFYTVTNSVLTASRFHELNVVYDVEKSRVVKLKAENSKLLEKIQNDDHDSMTTLTLEQVFWSKDLVKKRAEALKAQATPLKVLPPATVYPPNTPIHLVSRTLPTTSEVNIGLYVIT